MLTAIPAAAVAFLTCSMLPAIFIILSGGSYGEIALGLFLSIGIASMTLSVRHNFLTSVNLEKLRLLTSTLAAETAAASQAKTRFLANMSHELHTPLNAIIGFGEMIGSEVKGPVGNRTYAEFANSIVESARQLLTMIDDIFDLSRFESGDVKAAETEIAMAVLVDHAVAVVRSLCAKKDVTLETDVAPGLPALRIDEGRFHQILTGVLSNAVSATNTGGTIRFEARRDHRLGENGTPGIQLRISDSGARIPAEELPDILKPFVWTRGAEHPQIPGTALKLPLANQVVRAHGGVLEIDSDPAHGTTVTISLPPSCIVGYRSPNGNGYPKLSAAGNGHQE